VPDRARFPTLAEESHTGTPSAVCAVTNEGSRAVRYRTAVVVPPSQYEVILVSSWARYRLRGRNRTPATTH
jgi:hypothetical protein